MTLSIATNITGVNGSAFTQLAQATNTVTGDLFWIVMLLTVMVIILLLMIPNFGGRVAIGVAGFLGMFFGFIMRWMSLISQKQAVSLVIIAGIILLYLIGSGRSD